MENGILVLYLSKNKNVADRKNIFDRYEPCVGKVKNEQMNQAQRKEPSIFPALVEKTMLSPQKKGIVAGEKWKEKVSSVISAKSP
jgi:hypothetical protein